MRISALAAPVCVVLGVIAGIAAWQTWERAEEPTTAVTPELGSQAPPPLGRSGAGPAGHTGPSAVEVAPGWVARTAEGTSIPAPAVRAYARAELRATSEQPGCGIGWTTLAGIGHVESQHGTIGDRSLGQDAVPSTPVIGPALDGGGDYAAIRASAESVTWHGDEQWDHAIGPMQFIPSSWDRWQSDGDGDGVADPHDLDDAAYAAARYLCADGNSLEGTGWGAALFGYNHSDEYVRQVHDAAQHYANQVS